MSDTVKVAADGSAKVTVKLPPAWLLGRTAGWLRDIGATLPDNIPDCAIANRLVDGEAQFEWVSIDFAIDANGKVIP